MPPANDFFGPLHPEKTGEGRTGQMVSPPAVINGHLTAETAKKTRREINGEELGPDPNGVIHEARLSLPKSPSPVEAAVDGDGDVSMGMRADEMQEEPEPEPEPEPPVLAQTSGPSVGVQISPAKAADLSPDTAILDVAPQDHVTRSLWRPGDPTVFAAAGDSFCSIWRLSSSLPPVEEKIVEDDSDHALVSAVSWDPTGQKLAVATYSDLSGAVSIYNVHGYALDLLPEVSRIITGLHWTPNDSRLLIVASNDKVTELAIWDDYAEFVPPQIIDGPIYDFSWSSSNQAYVCGDGSVYQCDVDSGIHVSKTFPSDSPNTAWTFIRSLSIGSSSVAVATSSAIAALWVPTHDMRLDDAHHGDITAIELHAQPNTREAPKSPRVILASLGTDDTVKVWHVNLEGKRFDCLHRLFLGPSLPALAGGFSPDGYALAAASKDRLFIWNTERGSLMATWTVPGSQVKAEDGPDRAVNGQNGTEEHLPDRSLSWDTDGKKLAVGFGKQVCCPSLRSAVEY